MQQKSSIIMIIRNYYNVLLLLLLPLETPSFQIIINSSRCNSCFGIRRSTLFQKVDTDDNTHYDESQLVSDTPVEKRGIGVGIDLGTTNSAVAILVRSTTKNINREGANKDLQSVAEGSYTVIPKIVPIKNNGRTIPSVVSILSSKNNDDDDDDNSIILVGKEAIQVEHQFPYSSYRNVKRIIGTGGKTAMQNGATLVPNFVVEYRSTSNKKKLGDTTQRIPLPQQLEEAKTLPAKLSLQLLPKNITTTSSNTTISGSTSSSLAASDTKAKYVTPEYISSCVLKALFRAVEEETGDTVTRAVIGVPAFFNDAQREATEQACIMAGVKKVRLLREPEAAALAYGLGKDIMWNNNNEEASFEDELVLVFDLGGGTFDVSVLAVGGGIMEVVATTGNSMLGGSDFDRKISSWITNEIMKQKSSNNQAHWLQIESVQNAILRSAEAVRIYLTNNRQVKLGLPLTIDGWLSMSKPTDVILYNKQEEVTDFSDSATKSIHHTNNLTYFVTELSRKAMEDLCEKEFQSLLPPVREVALLANVLLPGDAPPSVAEAAAQLEKDLKEASESLEYENFYDESSTNNGIVVSEGSKKDIVDENEDEDSLLLIKNMDLKAMRADQRGGRKKARDLAARERTFRREKLRAETNARLNSKNRNQAGGNVKVQRSSYGRLLSQVVLVGGATRMPAIGRMLTALTGVVPRKTVNPDEAVALGAAIQVGLLDGDERLGGMQVLNPMQAAVLRAFAKKRQLDLVE